MTSLIHVAVYFRLSLLLCLADQQKVLQHHPDKQASKEDTVFKCIQAGIWCMLWKELATMFQGTCFFNIDISFLLSVSVCLCVSVCLFVCLSVSLLLCVAYEVLGNEKRRRAYDSVDPTFDDRVPPVCTHSRENFFEVFGAVFEENARYCATFVCIHLGFKA